MAKEDLEDQQDDEVEEQSEEETQDQADSDDPGVEGEAEDEVTDTEDGDEETDEDGNIDLIGKKKFEALKNDPVALRKELNRAATKKFQELADERRTVEPYAAFIKSFETDSVAATIALAERLGIKVEKPTTAAEAKEVAKDLADELKEAVKEEFGEEYPDLVDRLARVIHKGAKLVAAEEIKPVKQDQQELSQQEKARIASAALDELTAEHPDWKKYEKQMDTLSKQFPPNPRSGLTPFEYLEKLLIMAKHEAKDGDDTKRVAERMVRSARKGAEHGRPASTPTVSKSPAGGPPTWEQSVAAARRGERFD